MTPQQEAAMRQALELINPIAHNSTDDPRGKAYEAIAALTAALEQPAQQEPVAWTTGWHGGHCVIRAANPAAILPIGLALYTRPQAREPLTDEEIEQLEIETCTMEFPETVRAIEAKLKEKNNG